MYRVTLYAMNDEIIARQIEKGFADVVASLMSIQMANASVGKMVCTRVVIDFIDTDTDKK